MGPPEQSGVRALEGLRGEQDRERRTVRRLQINQESGLQGQQGERRGSCHRGAGGKGGGEEGFLDDPTEGRTWPQGGRACFSLSGEKGPRSKAPRWKDLVPQGHCKDHLTEAHPARHRSPLIQVQPTQELCPTPGTIVAPWLRDLGGRGQGHRTRGPTDSGLSPCPPDWQRGPR